MKTSKGMKGRPRTTRNLTEDIKLKFDGKPNQIEANTFINSLLHFTTIVQEVNKELKTNRKVEIKIEAFKEGSFITHLFIETDIYGTITNLFNATNISVASGIITIVGGLYQAAKFLKGKKGKQLESLETKGDTIRIENNNGEVTYIDNRVYHIYSNNKIIRNALSQGAKTLDNDENVTGFELLDKKEKPIVIITKEEFAGIGEMEEELVMDNERTLSKRALLNIISLSFENNKKWEFYYEGNKIPIKIDDNEFAKQIDNGEAFAKGDTLEADIEIHQVFDKTVNTYINKSYKLVSIINHTPRPKSKQTGMFNDDITS